MPEIFSLILFRFYNLIFNKGKIPEKLKSVTVIPIQKSGKPKNKFNSYRPVSIEKNILKLFGILIFNNINAFIVENNIIPQQQYGFKQGCSTFHQIIDMIDNICDFFNDRTIKCVYIIFLDLSSAFDSIYFDTILESCNEIEIEGNCLKILESYLFDNKFRVKYNDYHSNEIPILSGTPQGSFGSQTLLYISIRGLPNVLKLICKISKSYQYVDLYMAVSQTPTHQSIKICSFQDFIKRLFGFTILFN